MTISSTPTNPDLRHRIWPALALALAASGCVIDDKNIGDETETGTETDTDTDTEDSAGEEPSAGEYCAPSTLEEELVIEGGTFIRTETGPCGDVAYVMTDEDGGILEQGLIRPDGTIEELDGDGQSALFGPAGVSVLIRSGTEDSDPWTLRDLASAEELDIGSSESRGYLYSDVAERGELVWSCAQGVLSAHHHAYTFVADQDVVCSSVVSSPGSSLVAFADTDFSAWALDLDTGEASALPGIQAITAQEQDSRSDTFWVDFDGRVVIYIERVLGDAPPDDSVPNPTSYTLFPLDGGDNIELEPYPDPGFGPVIPGHLHQAGSPGALIAMPTGVGPMWIYDGETLNVHELAYFAQSAADGQTLIVGLDDNVGRISAADPTSIEDIGRGQLSGWFSDVGPVVDPSFIAAWSPWCNNGCHEDLMAFALWTEQASWHGRHRFVRDLEILRVTGNYALVTGSYVGGESPEWEGEDPFVGLHAISREGNTLETCMVSDAWLNDRFELVHLGSTRSLIELRVGEGGQLGLFDHDTGECTILQDSVDRPYRDVWTDVHQRNVGATVDSDELGARLTITPLM